MQKESPKLETPLCLLQDTKSFNKSQAKSCLVKGSYLNVKGVMYVYNNSIRFGNKPKPPLPTSIKPKVRKPRGGIENLSNSSRRRLIRLFSSVRTGELSSPTFVTLTYHLGRSSQSRVCKSHLNAFLQYFRRNYPVLEYIWRMEFQKRGAVHFHLMFFMPIGCDVMESREFRQEVRDVWHRIAEPLSSAHSRYGTDVRSVNNYSHGAFYVSKYIAKTDKNKKSNYLGRHWGHSTTLPTEPFLVIDIPSSFLVIMKRLIRKHYKAKVRFKNSFLKHLRNSNCFWYLCPFSFILDALIYSFDIFSCRSHYEITDLIFFRNFLGLVGGASSLR